MATPRSGGEAVEDGGGAVEGEEAQERVFKREVEAAGTGVALAAGAAAQLVVDAAAFVAFRTDDVQAAGFHDFVVFFLPAVFQLGDAVGFFLPR